VSSLTRWVLAHKRTVVITWDWLGVGHALGAVQPWGLPLLTKEIAQ
jgi:hypothetical protein